jgi:cellulose synthase/poly-beta-1,6-N-acetylglucosamine synthase-like glycosyltransferase
LQTFSFPWLRVIQNTGEGKKWAITTGVKHSTGDIIVTTDADCVVSPQWLGAMARAFGDARTMFAFGAVRIAPCTSFFSAMQAIEFASLGGTSAATAALGMPTMCNGANLAYRKVAFEAVKGYEGNLQIPSGDDEFLMRKIKAQYPHSIRFVAQEAAVVSTAPQPGLSSFFSQRLRWAAKWRHNTSAYTVVLAIFIFCCQLAVLVCLVRVATRFTYTTLILLLLKALLEAVFLSGVCRFLKMPFHLPAFVTLQFLYPLYAISVGVASNVMSYRWKGRPTRPKVNPTH